MPPVATLRSREPNHSTRPLSALRPVIIGPAAGRPANSTGFYSWACCVFEPYEFVYVYGLSVDCEWLHKIHRGTTLNKGASPSLALVRQRAEAAAAYLQELYQDVGSSWAMPVRDFLRERYGLDLEQRGRTRAYA